MNDLNGQTVAIVVDRDWSYIRGIRSFLGPADKTVREPDEGHTILAKVVDYSDARGLWIELNTNRHEADSAVPLVNLLIPWNRVLSIAVLKSSDTKSLRESEFRTFMDNIGYPDEE